MKTANIISSVYLFFLFISLLVTIKFYLFEKIKNLVLRNNKIDLKTILYFLILPVSVSLLITGYTFWAQSICNERDIFDGHTVCSGVEGLTHASIQNISGEVKILIFLLKIIALIFIAISLIKILITLFTTKRLFNEVSLNIISPPESFIELKRKIIKNLNHPVNFQSVNIPARFTGVIGFFKPVVVIPEKVLHTLDREELEALMYHEAGHIINKDNFTRFIIHICRSLLFFLSFKEIHYQKWSTERDIACDEIAVSYTGNPLALASALIKTAELSFGNEKQPVFSGFLRSEGNSIKRRLERLVNHCKSNKPGRKEHYSINFPGKGIKTIIFCLLVFYSLCIPLKALDFLHCFMEFLINIKI